MEQTLNHSSSDLKPTPFDTFTKAHLTQVLEAVENVTPVYIYSEAYLINQINILKEAF